MVLPADARAEDVVFPVLLQLDGEIRLRRQHLRVFVQPDLHAGPVHQVVERHRRRIDQRLGQLGRIHPVQRFEAINDVQIRTGYPLENRIVDGRRILRHVQPRSFEARLQEVGVHLVVVLEVALLAAFADLVERRQGDEDMPRVNQLRHVPEEKRQQQRPDVGSVDIRVGHDDHAVVAELLELEVAPTDAAPERGHERAHLRRRQHLVEARLLDVEDLALQRQDGLRSPVPTLFGGTACGGPLDQKHLGQRRILFLAVRELAREARDVQRPGSSAHFPGLARRFPRPGGVDDLADHLFGVLGVFLQECGEIAAQFLFDGRLNLARHQFVLGLRGELGIRHLDRDHAREALPRIVPGGGDLRLLREPLALHVGVEGSGHRGAKSRQVGAAIRLGNVVGVGEDLLLVAIVPLQGDFYGEAVVAHAGEVEDLVERRLVPVHVADERLEPPLVEEPFLLARPFVAEADRYAGVQEGQFAKLLGQEVVLELDIGEGSPGWLEIALRAPSVGLADHRQGLPRLPVAVGLLVDLALPAHGQPEDLR